VIAEWIVPVCGGAGRSSASQPDGSQSLYRSLRASAADVGCGAHAPVVGIAGTSDGASRGNYATAC